MCGSSPRGRGTRRTLSYPVDCARFIPARAGNTTPKGRRRSFTPVHPRAGGEHEDGASKRISQCGSSPRGRGTPDLSLSGIFPFRFIPARAGNTRSCRVSAPPGAVHPRAGGEHCWCVCVFLLFPGSSPRGRGTLRRRTATLAIGRFIPARAGNTRRSPALAYTLAVHPRAGGEHERKLREYSRIYGSSPRGRGTHGGRPGPSAVSRFIPARAGNT